MSKTYVLKSQPERMDPSLRAIRTLHNSLLRAIRRLDGAPRKVALTFDAEANRWRLSTGQHEFVFGTFIGAVDSVCAAMDRGSVTYADFAAHLASMGACVATRLA